MSNKFSHPDKAESKSKFRKRYLLLLLLLFGLGGTIGFIYYQKQQATEISRQKNFEKEATRLQKLALRKKEDQKNQEIIRTEAAEKRKLEEELLAERETEEKRLRKRAIESKAKWERIAIELPNTLDSNMVKVNDDYFDINGLYNFIYVAEFEISKYEVTQLQWQSVMGSNPSDFNDCPDCPVEQVSWNDVQVFIRKLNRKYNTNYRLPTSPEWSLAVLGNGRLKQYKNWISKENIENTAWCEENGGSRTHVVGSKEPRGFGLYDMNGNVSEWLLDVWPHDYNPNIKSTYERAEGKSDRVHCGGSWRTSASEKWRVWYATVFNLKNYRSSSIGFRLARSIESE